jgi:hypothetical protein
MGVSMKKYAVLSSVVLCVLLTGCVQPKFAMQVMSRSDGKLYEGKMVKTAEGQGTMTFRIGNVVYTGRFARTSSEQFISFTNAYATNNKGNSAQGFGIGSSFGSAITLSAILSSSSGDGMRCAFQGDRSSGTGSGICVDWKENVYDVIYSLSSMTSS